MRASDASIGKALWALGYVVSRTEMLHSATANDMFQELASRWKASSIQGRAYGVLGAANYLARFPGASDVRRLLARSLDELAKFCAEPTWIDQWETPDWPVAAQAMAVGAGISNHSVLAALGREMIEQLRRETSNGTVFLRRGENPDHEELPITAATFIEALGAAYRAERRQDILQSMRAAADWFLGVNGKATPVYDFVTGGCCDALTASGLNQNQGTQATTFFLLAFLTLTRIAGVGTPADEVPREDR